MKLNNKVNWVLIGLLILAMLAMAAPLWASGDDLTNISKNENILTSGDLIAGDQVSKNSSLALAQSLGDVDLGRAAQCVVTEQYGIIIWQRQNWEYDPWCIAGLLDEQGKHTEAAMMRCFHKQTAKLYGANCVEILTFSAPNRTSAPAFEPVVIVVEENDDDAEREARYSELTERLDKMDASRAANVRRYNRDQAAQKQANEDFYGGYIEKFEMMQQQEQTDNE